MAAGIRAWSNAGRRPQALAAYVRSLPTASHQRMPRLIKPSRHTHEKGFVPILPPKHPRPMIADDADGAASEFDLGGRTSLEVTAAWPTPQIGHFRASDRIQAKSVRPSTTDMSRLHRHVGFVPISEVVRTHTIGECKYVDLRRDFGLEALRPTGAMADTKAASGPSSSRRDMR
jgi:hypothetical protein